MRLTEGRPTVSDRLRGQEGRLSGMVDRIQRAIDSDPWRRVSSDLKRLAASRCKDGIEVSQSRKVAHGAT